MGHFRNCWIKGTILDTKKGLPLSLIVKIWIFIAFSSTANGNTSSVSYSMSVVNHSMVTESVSWSVNGSISESHIDVMNVTATMSHVMSNSVPVSSSPMLPPHCYRVCNCNNSVGYATSSMKYNMTLHSSSAMYNVTVSAMGNMSSMPSSDDYNMSSGSMDASPHVSPSPSSSGMAYTPSANVTPMYYSSTPWPAPSSSVSEPFHCPNVSCWVEIECMSHTHSISKTSYVSTSSVPPTVCPKEDCNGDCGGSAEEDCGICYGGNTTNENPRDCHSQCNGSAKNSSDTCFKCLLAGEDNVFKDCNNDCHGNAALDDCHVCTGGNTGKMANHLKDACGVCNGTNSTCIGCDGVPNSGLVFDACGKCGGDGTTCTALTTTVPQTIASGQPKVWVIGAGFNAGIATVCVLYNPDSGVEVVNTTATQRNLTHAHCVFQPWTNYTAGKYNLSVILVHDGGEQIKLNESVPIYYYNSSNLALRNVTPYEILKDDSPEYVTLVGNGFFDWKETVCYFNSSESKEIIFLNETHLKCKAPAAVTSTRFTVSLSMDGGLNTVGSAILTAYARAPNVTTVKFSDTASSILVLFDIDIDIANDDETCENFFSAEVVVTFGIDADCYLSSWREVTILLGAGANITTGDNLVFKDNVFQAYGETYSEFYSGSVLVQGPDDPLRPTPVITGPEVLSSCGNLSLSGSQSYGGGGRPLIFKWSVTSPDDNDVADITSVLDALSSDDDDVKIYGELLHSGKTYVFKLEAANFLNRADFQETTHIVTKNSDPVPALTLSSSIDLIDGEVYVSEEFSIKTNAIVAPCANNTRMTFSWMVTCTNPKAEQKVRDSASFQNTKNKPALRLSRGILTEDVSCTFNVTGSMSYDANIKSSVSVVIRALATPLDPYISGGDRQIGRDSGSVELDAETLTVDPDDLDDSDGNSFECDWSCKDGDRPCRSTLDKEIILSANSPCITAVQSKHFAAGKSYIISVTVSKGSRSASASITLTVVEGNPPAVWVDLAQMKVKASERVKLDGYYNSSAKPDKVEWSCPPAQGFSTFDLTKYTLDEEYYSEGISFAMMVIPQYVLKPGSKYRCKLTVREGSNEGAAFVVVEVRTGPSSGTFEVSPTSVQALDLVTMTAKQWTTDSDAGPLRYSFGELISADICETYGPPSSTPEQEDIVPPGSGPNNVLTLCCVIEDKFGSYAIKTFNITSSPPDPADLDPAALDNLFENAIDDKLLSGDTDKAMGALISITGTVFDDSSNTSDDLKRNISQKAQAALLQILDATEVDQDNAAPMLTALVQTDPKAAGNSSGVAYAAVKILDGYGEKPIPIEKADKFLDFISDLAGDFVENDTSLQENVEAAFDSLANNFANNLFLNDEKEIFNENLGSVKVKLTDLKSEMKANNRPGAPSFNPGPSLVNLFSGPRKCQGGKTCQGVVVQVVQYKKDLIAVDKDKQDDQVDVDHTQVLGIDLKDPVSKNPLPVTNLPQPLTLTFTVSALPVGKQRGCNYFKKDTKTWDKKGMTAVDGGNNTLNCLSTHATFFAPSNDASNATNATTAPPTVGATPTEKEDKNMTAAIVGGVIGGLVFIALVVGVIWYLNKNKNKNSGRISPEDPSQ